MSNSQGALNEQPVTLIPITFKFYTYNLLLLIHTNIDEILKLFLTNQFRREQTIEHNFKAHYFTQIRNL